MVIGSLRRLLGGTSGAPPEQAKEVAVAAREPGPQDSATPYLRRMPVFDAQRRIAGHLFHLQQSSPVPGADPHRQHALDAILLDTLRTAPDSWVVGLAFIPLSSSNLDLPALDQIPAANVVLLVQLADGTDAAMLGPRLAMLRARGMAIGLFRQPAHPALQEAIRHADYAAIDVAASDAESIRDFSAAIRAATPARLFACNVDTTDDFNLCEKWRYAYFTGRFAEAAEQPPGLAADPHRAQLLHLLRLVQGDAETPEIAEALKHDPLLSFRVLRYLNSPALGLSRRIDSLPQALTFLGRQRLTRWLTVMLFSVQDPEPMDWLVIERALTRGRLMELFAAGTPLARDTDPLFLTGIFSCLDRLLRRPLVDILADMPLAAEIRQALLDEAGPYAGLLALARACETFDEEQMRQAAGPLGIAAPAVNHALLAATAWAAEVSEYWE